MSRKGISFNTCLKLDELVTIFKKNLNRQAILDIVMKSAYSKNNIFYKINESKSLMCTLT